jgi:ABC-type branched-subunit amino acid transport system substrate-binding protein
MTGNRTTTASRSARRRRRFAAVAVACAVLTACGSQIPPSKFVDAQGGVAGGGTGVAAQGGGGTGGGGTTGGDTTNGGGGSTGGGGGTGGGSTGGGSTGGGSTGGGSTGGGSTGGGSTGGGKAKGGGGNTGGGSTGGGGTTGGAGGSVKAGSCAGFQNSKGITSSTIKIANIADTSGPVPGLFKSVQDSMKAYVAYFNATSSICGRKLSLDPLDSQTSSTGDQQAATSACSSDFAIVGSMGAFDDGGAQTVTGCGIPDLRTAVTESARLKSPDVYAAQSLNVSYEPTEPADYYKQAFGDDTIKHAAFIYLDAGASSLNADSEIKAWTSRGFDFIYKAGVPVTEFNYTQYASNMKAKGVKYVQYVGAYQEAISLAKAMAQQDFHPKFIMDPVAYDPGFVSSGGSAVEGTHVWINSALFEESNSNPELQNYLSWLKRVAGNASPTYFGIYAWGAGKLFTDTALKLGGKLTRQSLLDALKGVDNYTGNGLFGPQHVGAKKTGSCYQFITLKSGKWVREGPSKLTCGSTVATGVS